MPKKMAGKMAKRKKRNSILILNCFWSILLNNQLGFDFIAGKGEKIQVIIDPYFQFKMENFSFFHSPG